MIDVEIEYLKLLHVPVKTPEGLMEVMKSLEVNAL
jgi:hypothetical protein